MLGGGPQTIGLLYAAPAAGAVLAALGSGWTGRFVHTGRALVVAAGVWGLGAFVLGLTSWLPASLAALALMGFADTISKILRGALLQRHTPPELIGRVSSFWMMQAQLSPALGNAQIGAVSRLFSPAAALVAGGLLCMAGVGALAAGNAALRRTSLKR